MLQTKYYEYAMKQQVLVTEADATATATQGAADIAQIPAAAFSDQGLSTFFY